MPPMPPIDLLRLASLCLLLASAETLHGIARNVWLAPRVGKALATKLRVVSGSLLALGLLVLALAPSAVWWLRGITG
jgi:hypothetical protein